MHATAENFDKTHGNLLQKICSTSARSPQYGDIYLRLMTRHVVGPRGFEILTPKEYQVLWLLVRGQGAVITPDEMMYFLYEETDEDLPLGNSIQVFITRARKKIGLVSERVHLLTYRGFGNFLDIH